MKKCFFSMIYSLVFVMSISNLSFTVVAEEYEQEFDAPEVTLDADSMLDDDLEALLKELDEAAPVDTDQSGEYAIVGLTAPVLGRLLEWVNTRIVSDYPESGERALEIAAMLDEHIRTYSNQRLNLISLVPVICTGLDVTLFSLAIYKIINCCKAKK